MASTDKRMSAELYLSWEHLLAEEEAEPAQPSTPERKASPASPHAPEHELPSDLVALLAEKERLEKELKKLIGEAAPDPEDVRRQRMFPVKVHTKESRIEERRLRQRDEALRMQAKRVLEQRRIAAQLERRREQLEAQLRHAAIEEQRLRERWARERHEALLEVFRRRALEAEWQVRRERLREFRAESRPASGVERDGGLEAGRYLPSSAQQSKIDRQHATQRANALARSAAERAFEEARERQWRQALERAALRREKVRADEREGERQRLREVDRAREKREQRAGKERFGANRAPTNRMT